MANFYASYPFEGGGGGGVAIYATFADFPAGTSAGQLAVAADTGILYEWNGAAWEVIAGPGATLSVGTIDSEGTPSANGATISSNALILQSASGTAVGLVNTTTQTFAGQKTFSTGLTGTLTGSASLNVLTSALGTITELTSSVLTLSGWTDATVGSPTITVKQATTSTNGYLSSTDWNTFNGKQAAGNYITALTGDATASGPGSAALTLATVNSNIGAFASVTVNAKGLVTAAAALSGDATTSGAVLTLATVNSNTGSFGSSTSIPSFTVNAKGLITAASGNAVIAPAGTLSGSTLNSTVVSSSLTSVGTITSGTWNGTSIAIANGGTGQITANAGFNALSPMTTGGDLIYGGASGVATRLANGSAGQVLTSAGMTLAPTWQTISGTGTVTSVALTAPSIFTVTGSPVTTSGTLALTYSGTALPIANGGTNATTAATAFANLSPLTTAGDIIYENATPAPARLPIGTQGQVLTVASSGLPAWTTNPITTFQPVVAQYGLTTNQATSSGTILKLDTKVVDTNNAYSTSTGLFTAPVSGFYAVAFNASTNTSSVPDWRISKNSTSQQYILTNYSGTSTIASCASGIQLNAGDTIGIVSDGTATVFGGASPAFVTMLTITQVSGGSATGAIAAAASGSYTTVSNIVVMPTKTFDTNNAYSTSTGLFTVPVAGFYDVRAFLDTNSFGAIISAYVNGSYRAAMGITSPSVNGYGAGSAIVQVNAGDTIGVNVQGATAAATTSQEISFNLVSGSAGIVPSSNVQGTVSGGNATAGYLGEFVSANPGSPVTPAASTSFANVTSISLTAGDWDVYGTVNLSTSTTTATNLQIGVSTSSAAQDSTNNGGISSTSAVIASGSLYLATTPRRINITTTTIIYLVAALTYSVAGTDSYTTSSQIEARRVR